MLRKIFRSPFRAKDPVCRASVSNDTPFKWEYRGITYLFDTFSCMSLFQKRPGRFLEKKKRGFWDWLAAANRDLDTCDLGCGCGLSRGIAKGR